MVTSEPARGPTTTTTNSKLQLQLPSTKPPAIPDIIPLLYLQRFFSIVTDLTNLYIFTAYWIAFGPHGPRSEDPAGTGARVFWGVIAGVAASVAIFGGIRLAAKPAPHTMTKEWQEASNELLKVRYLRLHLIQARTKSNPGTPFKHDADHIFPTGAKSRSLHRYRIRRLQGPRPGPIPSQGCLKEEAEIFGRKTRKKTYHTTKRHTLPKTNPLLPLALLQQPPFFFLSLCNRSTTSQLTDGNLASLLVYLWKKNAREKQNEKLNM